MRYSTLASSSLHGAWREQDAYSCEPPLDCSRRVPQLHSEFVSNGNGSEKEHRFHLVAAQVLFREFLQFGIRYAMDGRPSCVVWLVVDAVECGFGEDVGEL